MRDLWKKILLLGMVLLLVFSMTACGGSADVDNQLPKNQEENAVLADASEKDKQPDSDVQKVDDKIAVSSTEQKEDPQKAEKKPVVEKNSDTNSSNDSGQTKAKPQEKKKVAAPVVAKKDTDKKAAKAAQPAPVKDKPTVTLSINGAKGVSILAGVQLPFEEGDTPFSILKKATRERKMPMSFNGSGNRVYVEGINNIYEFDQGPSSGWLYSVNGQFFSESCSAHHLAVGDKVVWHYTLDMGKDIGADGYTQK